MGDATVVIHEQAPDVVVGIHEQGSEAISAHVAAADPHGAYLKPSEVIAGTNVSVDTTTTPGSAIINAASGGLSQAAADARYVNLDGDVMTDTLWIAEGDLAIENGGLLVEGVTRSYFESALEAPGGVWLDSPPTDPIHATNKAYVDARTARYVHTQATLATTWVVDHNLGRNPVVTIEDSAKTVIHGSVVYTTLNRLVVTFAVSLTGKVNCS